MGKIPDFRATRRVYTKGRVKILKVRAFEKNVLFLKNVNREKCAHFYGLSNDTTYLGLGINFRLRKIRGMRALCL